MTTSPIDVVPLNDGELAGLIVECLDELRERSEQINQADDSDPTTEAAAAVLNATYAVIRSQCVGGIATLNLKLSPFLRDLKSGEEIRHDIEPATLPIALDLGGLYAGDTLEYPLDVPCFITTRTVTEPNRIELPAGWADELARSFASLPTVTVENVVQPATVDVSIVQEPARRVTLERDKRGTLIGATVEDEPGAA